MLYSIGFAAPYPVIPLATTCDLYSFYMKHVSPGLILRVRGTSNVLVILRDVGIFLCLAGGRSSRMVDAELACC